MKPTEAAARPPHPPHPPSTPQTPRAGIVPNVVDAAA
jgi:hypothetical protein